VTIRIALVEDHKMVLDSFEAALQRYPDIEVVADGSTVAEAQAFLDRDDLDVVVLDVRLADGNGLQLLAERTSPPQGRVLMVSSFNVSQYGAAAAKFGAAGFVLKAVPLPALVEAIRIVASGGVVFDAEQLSSRFVTLTSREREVLRWAMEGLSNKEIGAKLGLHRKTVEAYLSDVFEKYEVRGGRIELSIRAAEEGWLEIQPPTEDIAARPRARAPRRA
jgi:DNA-binding NarL/FixJ family response regulator